MAPEPQQLSTAIYNATWWVRHYGGCRNPTKRAQAIQFLGLTVREAFNKSDDFETMLIALVDGLNKRNEPPF
jgi:hypothetical protein